jgi:hypothetical protein
MSVAAWPLIERLMWKNKMVSDEGLTVCDQEDGPHPTLYPTDQSGLEARSASPPVEEMRAGETSR